LISLAKKKLDGGSLEGVVATLREQHTGKGEGSHHTKEGKEGISVRREIAPSITKGKGSDEKPYTTEESASRHE